MRRPGKRHLRNGALKDDAIVSQAVQGRSLDVGRAVTAQVIGANRVDRDENHIGCWTDQTEHDVARAQPPPAQNAGVRVGESVSNENRIKIQNDVAAAMRLLRPCLLGLRISSWASSFKPFVDSALANAT